MDMQKVLSLMVMVGCLGFGSAAIANEQIQCKQYRVVNVRGVAKTFVDKMEVRIHGKNATVSADQNGDLFINDVELTLDKTSSYTYRGNDEEGNLIVLKLPQSRNKEFSIKYLYQLADDESDGAGNYSRQSGCVSTAIKN